MTFHPNGMKYIANGLAVNTVTNIFSIFLSYFFVTITIDISKSSFGIQ